MANTTTASGGDVPRKPSAAPTPDMKDIRRKGLKRFLAEVGREMRKVDWPARSETNRLTGVVLGVCGIVVAILTIMGYVFDIIVTLITQGRLG